LRIDRRAKYAYAGVVGRKNIMRVFVGIGLNAEMKDSLFTAALKAQKLFPGRYTARDNYHCTLQFIGQADEAAVLLIEKAMKEAASRIDPFTIALMGLSFFRRPQDAVLFCGLNKSLYLEQLADDMKERLLAAGFRLEDGAFHSHITLARQAKLDPKSLSMIPVSPANQLVEEITLFESCRVEEQLRYVPLVRCPLGK
jgi:RNA 2',3'-cyclic 3'-phosphodiesterase